MENPDRVEVEGSVVWAEDQFAGKGQVGAVWESEGAKNITLSVVMKPHFLSSGRIFQLSKAVTLAVVETVRKYSGRPDVFAKWPNDILLGRKKIAGILIQNAIAGTRVNSSVVGIGLNVNQVQFSDEIAEGATSLALESGSDLDRMSVFEDLMQLLEKNYLLLKAGKDDYLDRQYLQDLFGYQERSGFRIGSEEFEGEIIGVDKEGRLAIHNEVGLRYFRFKEVEHCL